MRPCARGSWRLTAMVWVAISASVSCARRPPAREARRPSVAAGATSNADVEASGSSAPLIGLQRGGRWSVLTLRPPHLSGPHFHLMLKNSVLSGSVSSSHAPAGTLRVNITEDGAEGFGPVGPVSLDFTVDDESTVAEGMWNGGRVHLVFARGSLKGTVTTNSYFYAKTNPAAGGGYESMRSRMPRMASGQNAVDMFDPLPSDSSCEYFLTELTPDGALTGGSTCLGMPQQTRLEVPRVAQAYMTHAELVTVLVAVLSSPPVVVAEETGPRFEGPSNQTRVPVPPRPSTPARPQR